MNKNDLPSPAARGAIISDLAKRGMNRDELEQIITATKTRNQIWQVLIEDVRAKYFDT